MNICMNTRKYINILNKINFNTNYNTNFNRLHLLRTKSVVIIRDILENISIGNIEYFTIKHTNIENITLYLLKHSNKQSRNTNINQFIHRLKQNLIDHSEIKKFINFNNDVLGGFIDYLLKYSTNKEIQYLVDIYSDLIVSKFIPINIQTYILTYLKKYIVFDVTLDTSKINFKIYYKNTIDNHKLSVLILKAFYTVRLYNKQHQTININIFLTPNKKCFPEYSFLGPSEINSGLTSFSVNNTICIYREEEISKLIIHEMVHALNIDSMIYMNPLKETIEKQIKCNFNISNSNKINLNESFTETSAVIINSLINSILLDTDIDSIIDYEIKFSIAQCSNILQFYNENSEQFFNGECLYLNSNKDWIEKTSVLSYFFLKLANLHDIDFFINEYMFKSQIDIEKYYVNIKKNYKRIIFLKERVNFDSSLRMTLYNLIYI